MKKIFYTLILTACSTFIAYLYVLLNDGFGKGDVAPFAFYTIILSTFSLLLIGLYRNVFEKVYFVGGLFLCLVFSFVQTIIFVLLLWWVFGPWIGAISFPFQICWLAGVGSANLYILTTSESKFNVRHLLFTVGITALATLSVQLFNEGKDALAKQQNYDIICLVHRPKDTVQSSINDLKNFGLTEIEASTILEQDISGSFWSDTFFRISESKLISTDHPRYDFDFMEDTPGADIEFTFGNKLDSTVSLKSNKVIVIMNHPLEEDFEFREPLNTSMILIQDLTGNGFKEIRFGEEMNSKLVSIKNTDFRSFPYSTSIILDLKGRDEFRLYGFQWLEK